MCDVAIDRVNVIKRFEVCSIFFVQCACVLLAINYIVYNFFDFVAVKNYIRAFAFALICVAFLIRRKEYSYSVLIFIAIGIYSVISNGNLAFNLVFVFMLVSVIDIDKAKSTYRLFNSIGIILLAVVIISIVTGLVEINMTNFDGRLRYLLGFNNENAASSFFLSCAYVYIISRTNLMLRNWVIACISTLIVYQYTDSRTAFYSFVMFVVFCIVFWFDKKKYLLPAILIGEGLLFVSPFLITFIDALFPELDAIFSFRITIYKEYIGENSSVNLLLGGTVVEEVDSFYLMLLYTVGIPLYFIIFLAIVVAIYKMYVNNDIVNMAFVISCLCAGTMESNLLRPELLYVIVFWHLIICYCGGRGNHYRRF